MARKYDDLDLFSSDEFNFEVNSCNRADSYLTQRLYIDPGDHASQTPGFALRSSEYGHVFDHERNDDTQQYRLLSSHFKHVENGPGHSSRYRR